MALGSCTRCGSVSGRSKWCTQCKQEWANNNKDRVRASKKAYVDKFRAQRDALKDRPCADCGNKYHPRLMDFDHLPSHPKVHVIGRMQGNYSALLKETNKCDLLCVMCHRTRTHFRRVCVTKRKNYTLIRRQLHIAKAKGGPCGLCDKSFPSWQMDFDHLQDKMSDIAAAARKMTVEEIDLELKKCRLLCALCHRAHTFGVDPSPIASHG